MKYLLLSTLLGWCALLSNPGVHAYVRIIPPKSQEKSPSYGEIQTRNRWMEGIDESKVANIEYSQFVIVDSLESFGSKKKLGDREFISFR